MTHAPTSPAHDHFIRPMLDTYSPPNHMRGNPAAISRALASYESALSRYPADVLQSAWQATVESHAYWCWPSLPEALAACNHAQRRLHPPRAEEAQNRVQKAEDMAYAYRRRFMAETATAKRAEAEGWGRQLAEYVHEAASVQAQLICGVRPVGYGSALCGPSTLPADERKRLAAEALARAKAQAETGKVKVSVPRCLIECWRAQVNGAERGR